MCAILLNANSILGQKCIAKKIPVIIWIPKHNPSNLPKFHNDEIFDGVGRFHRDELKILTIGFVFICFIIMKLTVKVLFLIG